jgi:serine/threonine protein kinase
MAVESSAQNHDPTLIESLLDRQRDSWQRGERLLVEAFVEGCPAVAEDRERLLDLICNEMELRAASGEAPQLDEYRERFPTLSADLRKQFEVFAAWGPADEALETNQDADSAATPTETTRWRHDGYELLGELGRGAMGVVYKVRQTGLNRVVALKMILSGAYADSEELGRFRAEAEAVALLQHPNIVQIHQVGEQDGKPFLVLEFVAGGGLDKRLAGTPLPAAEAARLLEILARAMHQAHERGVIHRDLKPANVLLTEDGTPKVTDFGLAKRLDVAGPSQSGDILGTPSYMAPEQAAGNLKEIGPATDVYALGAILYECLTGRPPFKAATLFDTLQQVQRDDPVPPRRLQSKTPGDLETVCLKCLEKQPSRRYVTAFDLAEDLRRYQAGEPIIARPVGAWERAAKWVRRRPAVAAFMALFILSLVTGTVVSLLFGLQSNMNYHEAQNANFWLGQSNQQLTQTNNRLDQTNDRLRTTLADAYLAPLGLNIWTVTDGEIIALWNLADIDDEQVRLLFIERALEDKGKARQLRIRADLAIHTATGLNPTRRAKVEELLRAKLEEKAADPELCTDCLFIAAALDDWSPDFAELAANRTMIAMRKDSFSITNDVPQLAVALAAFTARIDPPKTSPMLSEAYGRVQTSRTTIDKSDALAALDARMSPEKRAKYFRPAMIQTKNSPVSFPLLQPWEFDNNLSPPRAPAKSRSWADTRQSLPLLMSPDEASKIIWAQAHSTDAMNHFGSSPADLEAALAGRMRPEEAAPLLSKAGSWILKAMRSKLEPVEPTDLTALSRSLVCVTARMGSRKAAPLLTEAGQLVLTGLAKTNPLIPSNFFNKSVADLAEALAVLAAEMQPKEAERFSLEAARRVLLAGSLTTDPVLQRALANTAALLIARIGRREMSRRSCLLVGALGIAAVSSHPWSAFAESAEASRPPQERFTEQELVNLLKLPTCDQPARQVLVRQLGWQCGEHFDNMWEFVDWAREHRPDLDLTSPPVRPDKL